MRINIKIQNIDNEQAIDLERVDPNNETTRDWYGEVTISNETYFIRFSESPIGVINNLEKHPQIISSDEFLENQINMNLISFIENEQMGIEQTEDEEIGERVPYDPKRIKIRSENWSIKYIFELITEYDDVQLSPDFQREFVWDSKRKSRLIESLMLGIPIPAFYLAENIKGKLHVVDGLQRLTVIHSFLKNEFTLRHLEYLSDECSNCYFNKHDAKKLEFDYVKRILQTQINVNIIESSSPLKVKYDVFRRINTGGRPLNNQEIRNCLAEPHARIFINELAQSEEFNNATGGSVKSTRMDAQEMVLRFIGFYYLMKIGDHTLEKDNRFEYKGDMQSFLDDTLGKLNKDNAKYHEQIKNAFINSMKNCYHLFSHYSFRKCQPHHLEPGSKRQLINRALFTTWSIALCDYEHKDVVEINPDPGMFSPILAEKLWTDHLYWNALSIYTNDKSKLDYGFEVAQKLIDEHLML